MYIPIRRSFVIWFILGLVLVSVPYVMVSERLGIKDFDLRIYIVAGALLGYLLSICYYLFLRLKEDRRYREVDLYWSDQMTVDLQEASNKYPFKHLAKDTPEFDVQFDKNFDYLQELHKKSLEEAKRKFNMSDENWQRFLEWSVMRKRQN